MDKRVIEQVFSQIAFALMVVLTIGVALSGFSRNIYANDHSAMDNSRHEVVQDLRYGVALWHYFQGQNLQALTELMVAEDTTRSKNPIQEHGDNPKIMKAALELAYGMVNHSKAAFESITDESQSSSVKSRAWYYLASIYYQRGDLGNALVSLENSLALKETTDFDQKAISLKLNVLIQQAKFEEAEKLIGATKRRFPDKAITLFNLGNAYSRKGKYKSALGSFDWALEAIRQQEKISQSDLLLADKIFISAGYAALFARQPQLALSYFSQSQQQSLDSDLALLGYGRSAVELEQYQQALNLFDGLAQKAPYKPAVQESLISVPAIYEQIRQPGKALRAYENAIAVYKQEISDIDIEIIQLRKQDLGDLFSDKSGNDESTHWLKNSWSDSASPNDLSYQKFSELFSESEFQADLRELKDLINLNSLATERLDRLSILKENLINRQDDRQSQWLQYGALHAEEKLEAYRNRLKQIMGFLQETINEKDYLALIPENRKQLLERIENSEQRIDTHKQLGKDLQKQKNLLRVYRGMLFWQAAQDYAEEKYAVEQSIRSMEQELELLANQHLRVARILGEGAIANNGKSESSYLNRIEQLERYTSLMSHRLGRKIVKSKAKVFGPMVALLESRRQKLHQYLIHARLASLRIYEEESFALNMPLADPANEIIKGTVSEIRP